MTQQKLPQRVLQQQLALDVYLSTLLEEVPEAEPVGPLDLVEKQPIPVVATSIETPAKVAEKPAVRLEDNKPRPVSPIQVVEPVNSAKLHPLSIMPDWSRQEFQALFFRVGPLILATPLIALSRTLKIDRKPGLIPGQPSWFIGLLDEHDSRIGVLDTGQLIYGKTRGARDLEKEPFQRILVTRDKRWGLACDDILTIGRLTPDKVRWRTSRQKKPWLIGTVIEELTAVIDVEALVPRRKIEN